MTTEILILTEPNELIVEKEVKEVIALVTEGQKGEDGAAGQDGADGVGIPAGGAAGQLLAKASNADYDSEWIDAPSGGGGGAVDSVNGQTGVVTLTAADVGAAPTNHTHSIANVTGLQTALDNKQPLSTILTNTTAPFTVEQESKVAGIAAGATANATDAALRDRSTHTGTQTAVTISDFSTAADARITAQKAQPDGLATLGGDGKIPTSQLPALAITDTFVVNSQAAQLALDAQQGDTVVRTDLNKSFIHNGGTSGTMTDYQELLTPTDSVLSVNGQTGAVTLTKSDVGLSNVDNTSDADKPVSTATQAALDGKQVAGSYAAAVHSHAIADVTGLQTALDSKLSTAGEAATVATINGKINQGTNVTITGTGTAADPYVISSSGGGGSSDVIAPDNRSGWVSKENDFAAGITVGGITNTLTAGTGASGGALVTTSTAGLTRDACGIVSLSTGTTGTGRGGRALLAGNAGLGIRANMRHGFGARVYVNNAPDATEDFYVFVGNVTNATDDPRSNQSFGLYYDRTFTNWQVLYHNGLTAAYSDTGIPFAAQTWFDLAVEMDGANLAGDVAKRAFVNGTQVHSSVGYVSVTALINFCYHITKIAGTTARLMYIDYEFYRGKRT